MTRHIPDTPEANAGPTTGERPIFAGRFNMTSRRAVESERVDLLRGDATRHTECSFLSS